MRSEASATAISGRLWGMMSPVGGAKQPGQLATEGRMTVDKSGITSAGILLFRRSDRTIEVLLGHPGGPFWQTRDHGHWTVPKGEVEAGEAIVDVARREFAEETGQAVDGPLIPLGEIRQKSGKVVVAFGAEGDLDPALAHSNTFSIEWPPKSGQRTEFPELDRVAWFGLEEARARLKDAQVPFLDRLVAALGLTEGAAWTEARTTATLERAAREG